MNRIKRPVAATVLFTFLAMVLQPLSAIAQDRPQSSASRRAAESGEEKFSRTLNEIHEILKEVAPQAAMPHMFPRKPGEMELRAIGPNMKIEVELAKPAAGVDVGAKVAQLRAKARDLASLEQHVRAGFDDTARQIKEANLPPEILARHEEALKTYEARAAEFKVLLAAVERLPAVGGAPLQTALSDLAAFMAKYPNQKAHTPTDPNNLPWGSPKPVTREPYTRPSQFRTSKLFGEPIRVAQAGSLSGISLPSATLSATPVPADTAPTEDVQITQPIRDLAASLGNNPVRIYNWVRKNIQFVPSYGSIQGSDMTLQMKRGNAFDTASLLIALLRAANIPARYVYGTVQVPAANVMNWVGGVTVPHAAVNLMWQGGIPAVGVTQSGQVTSIRFEHVWVEAHVDYIPSRGAVHREGDTWVPLDATFKQYQFTQGVNLSNAMPFDAQSLLTQIHQGSTLNESEGWVQNLNQSAIQNALAAHRTALQSHVDSQNPGMTLSQAFGAKTVVQENPAVLFGTLPYRTIATGAKFQRIPDNLRWKVKITLASNTYDFYLSGSGDLIEYEQNFPAVVGRKITLGFIPATQADADAVRASVPQFNGTLPSLSAIPTTLSGLLRLRTELRVDGQIVASSTGSTTMGQELMQRTQIFDPARGWGGGEDNAVVTGEYNAFVFDGQGLSLAQLQALHSRMAATRALLETFRDNPSDTAGVSLLSAEDIGGDFLYSAILGYFASIDAKEELLQRMMNQVVGYRMPSYGRFFAVVQPRFFFGVVRSVGFPAFAMDVDYNRVQAEAKDNDPAKRLSYVKQIGVLGSAAEHQVPERLFRDPSKPANDPSQVSAVSAVKALSIASGQGQRIYALTPGNSAIHTSALSQIAVSPDVKAEIANALAAGREVMVHQAEIAIGGFTGAGYIIVDPETGSGAYKIEGGANGAWVNAAQGLIALLIIIKFVVLLAFFGIIAAGISPLLIVIAGAITLIAAYMAGNPYQDSPVKDILELIVSLTAIGILAALAFPLLFAFIYFALLIVVASILFQFMATRTQPGRTAVA